MSFSSMVKEEMTGLTLEGEGCCTQSELAGIVLASGSIHLQQGALQAGVTTESPNIARRVYRLVKLLYGVAPEIEQHERHRLNRNFSYSVVLSEDGTARKLLEDCGLLGSVQGTIPQKLVRKSCCRNALLRGLFLGCGSMSDPGRGYHLELVFENEALAAAAEGLLEAEDINARAMPRKGRQVVYLKGADHISAFLALTGAHAHMLKLEGIRVEKGVRNTVNRVVNCDTANLEKTLAAAQRQVECIRRIEETRGLASLPESLRAAAEARLEHPDGSLDVIAELLGGVSKSGLNHRFKRLEQIAAELTTREEPVDEPQDFDHSQR